MDSSSQVVNEENDSVGDKNVITANKKPEESKQESETVEIERQKEKKATRRNSRAEDVLGEGSFQLRRHERERAESVSRVEVLISVGEEKF